MIGIAFLALAALAVIAYTRALDARDERRRQRQLADWYAENEGRQHGQDY